MGPRHHLTSSLQSYLQGYDKRERERNLYFPMVTGLHYGTKTPPDQQPMRLSQAYDETRLYAIYSVF